MVATPALNRQNIPDRLREKKPALRERGVTHTASFGSVAPGEQRPESDMDIMVEIATDAPVGVVEYVAIVHITQDLFPTRVGVANRDSL